MRVLILAGLICIVCLQVNADEFVYENKSAGFSLRLPAEWRAYPEEMAARVAGFGAKLDPTPPPREIAAVFGRTTNLNEKAFPRIVLHVQPRAPIGETQFRALHMFPVVQMTVAQALGFRGRGEFMRSGRYDPGTQSIEFMFESQPASGVHIAASGRSFLTAEGLINVYCYSDAAEFDAWRTQFAGILSSFQLSAEHKYRPSTEKAPKGERYADWKSVGTVLGAMLIAGLAGTYVMRLRGNLRSDDI